jgi:hypothetical protein
MISKRIRKARQREKNLSSDFSLKNYNKSLSERQKKTDL